VGEDDSWSYAKYVDVLQQAFAMIRLVRTVVPKGHQFPFSNLIGKDGALELAKGIARSDSLTSVDLLGNPLTSEGIVAICDALAHKRVGGARTEDFREVCFSCWDEASCQPTLDAVAINALMQLLSTNNSLSLVDMGSVLLLQESDDLRRTWSRLTQPKRDYQGPELSPRASDGMWGKAARAPGEGAPGGTPGRVTNTNWKPATGAMNDTFIQKESEKGPVSASLFFKRPDLAREVYSELKQAAYLKTHTDKIKEEVAQVLQGERYIPQFDPEKAALTFKISRLDTELSKAKGALEEEELRVAIGEGEEEMLAVLEADVRYWERAVQQAVSTHYWQRAKKEQAEGEKEQEGWAPTPFRHHPREEETQVAFGRTTHWSPSKAGLKPKRQGRKREQDNEEEEEEEDEDEEEGRVDPLLQTALAAEAERMGQVVD